jgi:DNA repair exonuclease SbcCD ATPase subunit
MAEAAESRFNRGFRSASETVKREEVGPAIHAADTDQEELGTGGLIEQRDRALRLLEQAHAGARQRIEALVADHERQIASMIARHQEGLDALRAELDGLRHGRRSRPDSTRGVSATGGVPTPRVPLLVPLDGEGGSRAEELERENRELYEQLDVANAEIEETRADAVRLQSERDDALRANDDLRLQLLSELEAARDENIHVQAQLDEAWRTIEDNRDQAREEQYRLIEELDALHQELGVCWKKLAERQET